MGIQKKQDGTYYARYLAKGGRVLGLRLPKELNQELELRTKKRGLTLTAYVKTALYWYMRNEAVIEERLNQLVMDYERPVGTVES